MKNAAILFLTLLTVVILGCRKEPSKQAEAARQTNSESEGVNSEEGESSVAWRQKSLLAGYDSMGRHGDWNNAVTNAFKAYAERASGNVTLENHRTLTNNIQIAIDLGCDDPMVRYLNCRFIPPANPQEPSEASVLARASAEMLDNSSYHSVFKFYGNFYAWMITKDQYSPKEMPPQRIRRPRNMFSIRLLESVNDTTVPVEEISQMVAQWLPAVDRTKNWLWVPNEVEGLVPELAKRGNSVPILFARAKCATVLAYQARGTGYADSVTPEGWKVYEEKLKEAQGLMTQAWQIDTNDVRIPTTMLQLALGLGFERPEMEQWFSRALQLNTNNYDACSFKLNYLKPKWHGSQDEMLEFARQCLTNHTGDRIPLIITEAHEEMVAFRPQQERLKYFGQPAVWREIDQGFKRFFSINPEAVDYRHNYAWFAYYGGDWQKFTEQIAQFSTGTNYAYFGGQNEFERMVAKAQNAGK